MHSFSLHARIRSFRYALAGIGRALRTEHNTWIHGALTAAAFGAGLWLRISAGEFAALVCVMALVWMAELMNTALEKAMDFITLERHPQIKAVKDIAAGAVLVSALAAAIVGALIFLPKLITL
ncbi:MAG TPA: diacylglycerol kinase family protein [Chitinophagaceae bacterium]|jgi:diacylglycerol kinase|nr:diacylglycerol kinase family protein [Chitinophagaceae bacterium]